MRREMAVWRRRVNARLPPADGAGITARMRLDATPFLLIDAAGGGARLYRSPRETIVATTPAEVAGALARVRAAVRGGGEVAGFLAYEAGAGLAARPLPERDAALPLAWFGVFDAATIVADVAALLPDAAGAWIGAAVPTIDRAAYDAAFARVADWIEAGDLYQANLTFRAEARVMGNALALYAGLRARSRSGHGALVWTGTDWLVSLSPELFFALDGERVTARPMKGTATRGETPEADRAAAEALAADAKQRAENLMIVDLIRNDLSRVATAGSVAVPDLFAVETYPSVHQMTSTVTATLAPGQDAVDLLAAAFPCGSITGAPKQRAMEVIAMVEPEARGIYTGSIGWISRDAAAFNVAIRTLHWTPGAPTATLGLGSGIVADSRVDEEWDECLAKAAFLTHGARAFDLIETMAFDPEAGLLRLERHLARMKASAEAFGFVFDRHGARNELQAATFRLRGAARVRLLLAASGAVAIEIGAMPQVRPMTLAVVPLPVESSDFRLRHKTSDRGFYDAARAAAGTDEVVFVDAQGFLTEGSFTSLFVARGDVLVTPPLARGLLPGVLRGELIDSGRAIEGELTPDDLRGTVYVGNAVRGLVAVVTVVKADGTAL